MHGPGLSECKCFNTQNFSVRSTWDKISWTKAMAPQLKTWRLARVWSSLPSRSQNQFSSGPSSSRTRSSQGSSNINPTLFRSTLSTFSIQAIATDHQSGRYDRHQTKRGGTVCAYLHGHIIHLSSPSMPEQFFGSNIQIDLWISWLLCLSFEKFQISAFCSN